MKLFIFEPYSWSYCGGVIGIIAEDFKSAVNLIVTKAEEEAKERNKILPQAKAKPHYKHKYFAETADNFRKDHGNQWLLTESFDVPDAEARIVFDNWNYA